MEHNYLIPDEAFAQYVYHCMCGASKDKIRSLEPHDLVYFSTTKRKKDFAEKASLEQRLRMLAILGVSYCIVAARDTADVTPILDEVSTVDNEGKKKLRLTDAMAQARMFVISSRDVLISAHLAAQQVHNKVYLLSQHHLNAYTNLKEASEKIAGGKEKDARDAFGEVAGLVLDLSVGMHSVNIVAGCSPLEMRILLALYQTRHGYVTSSEIATTVGNDVNPKVAAKTCTLLEKRGFLTSLRFRPGPLKRIHKFIIMERGIDAVHNWIKYLVRNAGR